MHCYFNLPLLSSSASRERLLLVTLALLRASSVNASLARHARHHDGELNFTTRLDAAKEELEHCLHGRVDKGVSETLPHDAFSNRQKIDYQAHLLRIGERE